MPVPPHHTDTAAPLQLASLGGATWTTEVVPWRPATLAAQGRPLKAFQRVRGLATATDLLRVVLAFVLDGRSTRALGAWAVLVGLADLSATAWRKRLRACNAWVRWLRSDLLATARPIDPRVRQPGRHIRRIAAPRLGQVGGPGDAWRVHLAYALLAGRLAQVLVTDHHGGARLTHFGIAPDDILVGDGGYGFRTSVATARAHPADVVLRIHPATFPLETAAGPPWEVERWLAQHHGTVAEWAGWGTWRRQRYQGRLIATKLPPDQAQQACKRKRRQAQKAGRRISARTLRRAGWLLVVTTLEAARWVAAAVLRLDQARWQVELVCKRSNQLLRVQAIRRRHRDSVEATIRARLVAWAVQEQVVTEVRAVLPTGGRTSARSWLLAQVSLDTLRQQVRGTWTLARVRACLPRLRRLLVSSPRRRVHQEATVRQWLAGHAGLAAIPLQEAA